MVDQERFDLYSNKLQEIGFIELKRKREETAFARKMRMFKVNKKNSWMQFKYGAYYGFLSGGLLGFVMGLPMYLKYRQPSIIALSIVSSGCFFASIGGFGSLLHSE